MKRIRKIDELRDQMKNQLKISTQMNKNILNVDEAEKKALEEQHIYYIESNFEEYYADKEILGEGCMGLVRKVIRRSDLKIFACKLVKTSDEETIQNIITEFKHCSSLIHPNIVQVHELYIDTERGRVYTIMECVNAKEMFNVIQKLGCYSESTASLIFKQILMAIHYLHQNLVCHRDLKPNNILASEDGMCVKITDFNVSKFGENKRKKFQDNIKMMTYTGTVAFSAPEIFCTGCYNEEVDMWSAGVVLYTMLSGKMPFEAEYLQDLIEKIKLGEYELPDEYWASISDSAKDLVKQCLKKDPRERITPDKALLHPWITQRQNTSPLQMVNIQNLKDNAKRFITKFSALKELGLMKDVGRKHTIGFSLFHDSPNNFKKSSFAPYSHANLEHRGSEEKKEFDDLSSSADRSGSNRQIGFERDSMNNLEANMKELDELLSNDSKENLTKRSEQLLEDYVNCQEQDLQDCTQSIENRQFRSNIIHNRYQFCEKIQMLMQNYEKKQQFRQRVNVISQIYPLKMKYEEIFNQASSPLSTKKLSLLTQVQNEEPIRQKSASIAGFNCYSPVSAPPSTFNINVNKSENIIKTDKAQIPTKNN